MSTAHAPRSEEPCVHSLWPGECPYCDFDQPRPVGRLVYVTEYGEAYHFLKDCPALLFGQMKVEERGGTPSPIETVSEDSVKFDRHPCPRCKPGSKLNPL